ncbi:MAG: hypothetical protein VX026_14165, partial [Myxococcota bacterium]|nr:hypothetical protein [Myxococcota bacterium]
AELIKWPSLFTFLLLLSLYLLCIYFVMFAMFVYAMLCYIFCDNKTKQYNTIQYNRQIDSISRQRTNTRLKHQSEQFWVAEKPTKQIQRRAFVVFFVGLFAPKILRAAA